MTLLTAAGVAPSVAAGLVTEHPAELVRDAVEAVAVERLHNPAGWLVRAISGRWDLSAEVAEARAMHARARARARVEAAGPERRRRQRERAASSIAWASAVSAALDDTQLVEAVQRLTQPTSWAGSP